MDLNRMAPDSSRRGRIPRPTVLPSRPRPAGPRFATSLVAAVLLPWCAGAVAAQQRDLAETEGWQHLMDRGRADPGIGVLTFAPNSPSARDTIPLYNRAADAQPAGYVAMVMDSIGGERWVLAWPRRLATNLIEFDYEIPGLPVDSLADASGWARVLPGFLEDGTPVHAWARLVEGSVVFVDWKKRLPQSDLFFAPGITPAFADAPEGGAVAFALPAGSDDYILHPLEVHGDWMRVRAVTPSDMCGDPASPSSKELWIRYLTPAGRPRVWYYTRGC